MRSSRAPRGSYPREFARGTWSPVVTISTDRDRVRRWRSYDLAAYLAVPRPTVLRVYAPALIGAGVLARRGRYLWGRAAGIDAFMTGRWTADTTVRRTPRRTR